MHVYNNSSLATTGRATSGAANTREDAVADFMQSPNSHNASDIYRSARDRSRTRSPTPATHEMLPASSSSSVVSSVEQSPQSAGLTLDQLKRLADNVHHSVITGSRPTLADTAMRFSLAKTYEIKKREAQGLPPRLPKDNRNEISVAAFARSDHHSKRHLYSLVTPQGNFKTEKDDSTTALERTIKSNRNCSHYQELLD
ncbi:hypothetical protein [Paraburkholderia humisilvae]|uniref:Uncharacterized protein n=1 Tax=Paraburkholderia humisilvae TaxID=627669 RepID=A0A6J5FAM5_9BURK|nr:hypothetical protein [Paraburkholderia humisilvae]CAB3774517.1 hypothetical protein LMG29542_07894 [Paraburkholderia humisilvae]